ncbi:MAG: hypothetical protein A2096_04405 [Spirochaetes bacterium GWF1_41_5]|nr:MAG: hypothetical protein A2096_04405 [Spirochaetes bacterium GWF1_41_5]HBE01210.1 xylose isomerase [Spirochaetia bacterium]
MKNKITIFTKPWVLPAEKLAELTADLGADGVELAVRKGYAVNPDNISTELPRAAEIFRRAGLVIGSIAGDTDEKIIAACGESGIPIIRICVGINMSEGYLASEKKIRSGFDKLLPALEKHHVAIGVQNHYGFMIGSAVGLLHLIEQYNSRQICAVLDPAHCAIAGEPETMALDIIWNQLGMVNFKSASRMRINGPDEEEAKWKVLWTTAQHSGYSWRSMLGALARRSYPGVFCLPAEYSHPEGNGQLMGDAVIPLLKKDITYLKKLMKENPAPEKKQNTEWQSTGDK